ncbi:MAG: DUF4230 domain-containing protein [Myxococcota bacterium]
MMIAAGLLAGGLIAGTLAGRLTAPKPPPAKTEVVYRSPAVVTAVQRLARLESARFHMERVIDIKSKQKVWLGLVDAEDALLLIAGAEVTAGVDLSKLKDEHFDIDRKRGQATITLPAPEIFDAVLDEKRTYVYRRDTDTLADRDGALETKARRAALDELAAAARRAGILDVARTQAEATIHGLVQSLGYEKVVIKFDGE